MSEEYSWILYPSDSSHLFTGWSVLFMLALLFVYTLFSMAIHTLKKKGFGPAWAFGFYMGTVSKVWDQKMVLWRVFPGWSSTPCYFDLSLIISHPDVDCFLFTEFDVFGVCSRKMESPALQHRDLDVHYLCPCFDGSSASCWQRPPWVVIMWMKNQIRKAKWSAKEASYKHGFQC